MLFLCGGTGWCASIFGNDSQSHVGIEITQSRCPEELSDRANYNTEFNALQQQLHSNSDGNIQWHKFICQVIPLVEPSERCGQCDHFTSDKGAAGSVVSLSKMLLVSALTFTSATSTTLPQQDKLTLWLLPQRRQAHRLCRSDPSGSASSRRHWKMWQPCGQLTLQEWQGSNLQKIMQG